MIPIAKKINWNDPGASQKLVHRVEQSYRTKDGLGFKGILEDSLMGEILQVKPAIGRVLADIIPYAAGPNDPEVIAGRLQEGDPTYLCQVYTHNDIGPNKDRYICLAKTYGRPCFVCDYRAELNRDPNADDDLVKSLRPSKNAAVLYNAIFHTDPNRISWAEPVKVWNISGYFMESKLQAIAKSPVGGGFVNYASWLAGEQGGRHISFEIVAKGQYFDYTGQQFVMRQSPVPQAVLDRAYCLDMLLHIPDYKEVQDAFLAGFQPEEAPAEVAATYEVTGDGILAPGGGSFVSEPQCPFPGVTIGIDWGKYENCQGCVQATICSTKYNQMVAPPPAPVVAPTPTPTPVPSPAGPGPAAVAGAPVAPRPAPLRRQV